MSLLWWLLIGFLGYWAILALLARTGRLPENVETQGPIITVHTLRGRRLLERIARRRRFWRAWGNLGVGIALVIMLGMFLVVINAAIASAMTTQRNPVAQPQNVLVIPGLNEFLPLSVAPEIVAGLLVGLVVHEGGHGLLCRVEDIDIDSMGVALVGIIPIGAFVQPDEQTQRAADRGSQSRMFAAGVMNNFAVTVVAFGLLFAIVGGMIGVAPGAAIVGTLDGSAADEAGLGAGDRIVAVDGMPIADANELDRILRTYPQERVDVARADGSVVPLERSLLVVGAVPDGPAGLSTADRIAAVDGEPMHTEAALYDYLANETVVRVETAAGEARTFPAGIYVPLVAEGSPIATAGAPEGPVDLVITAIDGQRVVDHADATTVLETTEPGETVPVEAYDLSGSGEGIPAPETYDVVMGEHEDGHGYLGVAIQPGIAGVTVDDFGAQFFPSDRFLATLGGDGDASSLFGLDTFFGRIFSALVLPLAGLIGPGIEQNFAGFTGHVANFYEVHGPLAAMPGVVFVAANALFWTGWINFNLAIFNCIPAFPLDGGHLLRASAEAIVSRLPVDNRYLAVKYVTVSIGVAMLAGLVVMIFGQGLLT